MHFINVQSIAQELLAKPWIGQRFSQGHEKFGHHMGFLKSIRPTRTTFNGGLHMGGACRLPPEWNGCKDRTDFYSTGFVRLNDEQVDGTGAIRKLHFDQHFDEIVLPRDAKLVEPMTEGVLNHVQYRRLHIQASNESVKVNGEYTASFFPAVYEEMERRGLVMPMELPEREQKPYPPHEDNWADFSDLRIKVEEAAEECLPWKEEHVDSLRLVSGMPNFTFKDIMPSNSTNNNSSSFAHRHDDAEDDPVSLPAFSTDGTEIFLASMIEREADSWDLYLTTFLLCHDILQVDRVGLKATQIRPDKETIISWSKLVVASYNTAHPTNGRLHESPNYYCKIRASSGGDSYSVQGELTS